MLEIHVYHHFPSSRTMGRIEDKLDEILDSVGKIQVKEEQEMIDLDLLTAEVSNNSSVINSGVTALQTIAAEIQSLKDQLAAAIAANDPAAQAELQAKLDSFATELHTKAESLAAAIAAVPAV